MKLMTPLTLMKELKKVLADKPGVIVGLDVGTKYVGVSKSTNENKDARPVSQLLRTDDDYRSMVQKLMEVVNQPISGVIVGYPYKEQADNNPKAFHIKEFTKGLSDTGVLGEYPYTYWEENFTSKLVDQSMEPLDLSPSSAKHMSDTFAAVSILQGYLDYFNKNA